RCCAHRALHSFPTRRSSDLIMRDVVGKNAPPQELLNYAWTLPGVASAVVGHHRSNTLQENISIARQLTTSSIENFDRYSAWHEQDRKSTRLNSSHVKISYAV